jgi:hypothetical protein
MPDWVMVASASYRSSPRDATLEKLRDASTSFRENYRGFKISETT